MLRHTYASVMLEGGESVVTLAQRLGHSSLDYAWLLHALHAGSRESGPGCDRRIARCGPPVTPQFSPGLIGVIPQAVWL